MLKTSVISTNKLRRVLREMVIKLDECKLDMVNDGGRERCEMEVTGGETREIYKSSFL